MLELFINLFIDENLTREKCYLKLYSFSRFGFSNITNNSTWCFSQSSVPGFT